MRHRNSARRRLGVEGGISRINGARSDVLLDWTDGRGKEERKEKKRKKRREQKGREEERREEKRGEEKRKRRKEKRREEVLNDRARAKVCCCNQKDGG